MLSAKTTGSYWVLAVVTPVAVFGLFLRWRQTASLVLALMALVGVIAHLMPPDDVWRWGTPAVDAAALVLALSAWRELRRGAQTA